MIFVMTKGHMLNFMRSLSYRKNHLESFNISRSLTNNDYFTPGSGFLNKEQKIFYNRVAFGLGLWLLITKVFDTLYADC